MQKALVLALPLLVTLTTTAGAADAGPSWAEVPITKQYEVPVENDIVSSRVVVGDLSSIVKVDPPPVEVKKSPAEEATPKNPNAPDMTGLPFVPGSMSSTAPAAPANSAPVATAAPSAVPALSSTTSPSAAATVPAVTTKAIPEVGVTTAAAPPSASASAVPTPTPAAQVALPPAPKGEPQGTVSSGQGLQGPGIPAVAFTTMEQAAAAGVDPFKPEDDGSPEKLETLNLPSPEPLPAEAPTAEPTQSLPAATDWSAPSTYLALFSSNKEILLRFGVGLLMAVLLARLYLRRKKESQA